MFLFLFLLLDEGGGAYSEAEADAEAEAEAAVDGVCSGCGSSTFFSVMGSAGLSYSVVAAAAEFEERGPYLLVFFLLFLPISWCPD